MSRISRPLQALLSPLLQIQYEFRRLLFGSKKYECDGHILIWAWQIKSAVIFERHTAHLTSFIRISFHKSLFVFFFSVPQVPGMWPYVVAPKAEGAYWPPWPDWKECSGLAFSCPFFVVVLACLFFSSKWDCNGTEVFFVQCWRFLEEKTRSEREWSVGTFQRSQLRHSRGWFKEQQKTRPVRLATARYQLSFDREERNVLLIGWLSLQLSRIFFVCWSSALQSLSTFSFDEHSLQIWPADCTSTANMKQLNAALIVGVTIIFLFLNVYGLIEILRYLRVRQLQHSRYDDQVELLLDEGEFYRCNRMVLFVCAFRENARHYSVIVKRCVN